MNSEIKILENRLFKIQYSEKDSVYIDNLYEFINKKINKIISFFEIKKFNEKIYISLNQNISNFQYKLIHSYNFKPEKWLCGYGCCNNVEVLTYSEHLKLFGHKNDTLEDYFKMILHEIVHCCHSKLHKKVYASWLSDGVAIFLSEQKHSTSICDFNSQLDEVINGTSNYDDYLIMFKYAYDNYGYEYIKRLINDSTIQLEETKKIYDALLKEKNLKLYKNNI